MAYNTWFTKLYCKDLRIVSRRVLWVRCSNGNIPAYGLFFFFPKGSEVTEQVLHTVSKSSSLEEITLENTGLKS